MHELQLSYLRPTVISPTPQVAQSSLAVKAGSARIAPNISTSPFPKQLAVVGMDLYATTHLGTVSAPSALDPSISSTLRTAQISHSIPSQAQKNDQIDAVQKRGTPYSSSSASAATGSRITTNSLADTPKHRLSPRRTVNSMASFRRKKHSTGAAAPRATKTTPIQGFPPPSHPDDLSQEPSLRSPWPHEIHDHDRALAQPSPARPSTLVAIHPVQPLPSRVAASSSKEKVQGQN